MAYVGKASRICIQAAAIVFTIFALAIMAAALGTQGWQFVHAPEIEQYYMRGLFQDCSMGARFGRNTDTLCQFTIFDPTMTMGYAGWSTNPYYASGGFTTFAGNGTFKFEPYRLVTLICVTASLFFGLLGMIFLFCAGCNIFCSVFATIFIVLGELASIGAVLVFYRNAIDPANLQMVIVSRPAEQRIGYSFYIAVGGCVGFLLAMALSIATSGLVFTEHKERRRRYMNRDSRSRRSMSRAGSVRSFRGERAGSDSPGSSRSSIVDDYEFRAKYANRDRDMPDLAYDYYRHEPGRRSIRSMKY